MTTFREYLVEYRFQGEEWDAVIQAESFDDAKRRIETMGAFGRIKGEVMARVPAGGGVVVRAFAWLANLLRPTQ